MTGSSVAEGDEWLPGHVGAAGEADVHMVVDTARLSGADTFATILKTIGA